MQHSADYVICMLLYSHQLKAASQAVIIDSLAFHAFVGDRPMGQGDALSRNDYQNTNIERDQQIPSELLWGFQTCLTGSTIGHDDVEGLLPTAGVSTFMDTVPGKCSHTCVMKGGGIAQSAPNEVHHSNAT